MSKGPGSTRSGSSNNPKGVGGGGGEKKVTTESLSVKSHNVITPVGSGNLSVHGVKVEIDPKTYDKEKSKYIHAQYNESAIDKEIKRSEAAIKRLEDSFENEPEPVDFIVRSEVRIMQHHYSILEALRDIKKQKLFFSSK